MGMEKRWATLLLLGVMACAPGWAQLSLPGATAPAPAQPETPADPMGRTTPRGAVLGFLNAAHKDDLQLASLYLDTKLRGKALQELAQQFAVVLDRRLPARLNMLSDKPEGSQSNPLKPNEELVGTITTSSGDLEVKLVRVNLGAPGKAWLFSADTLETIPDVYQEVNAVSVESFIPGPLVRMRLGGVPLFEWLAVFIGLPGLYLLAALLARGARKIGGVAMRRIKKNPNLKDPELLPRPVRLLIVVIVIRWTMTKVELPLLARQFWTGVAAMLTIGACTWMVILVDGMIEERVRRHFQARNRSGATSIVRLIRRIADLAALFIGLLVALYYLGVNPTAALAGLGVGGIAVALAAQKTLENVIGGVSLIFDQPVRVGDTLKVGETVGTVEDIGLRSTRIRTLERTVVSVPNGQIANLSLENLSFRDKFWLHPILGLRYETTAEQMRAVLEGIRGLLVEHSRVDLDSVRVCFLRMGAFSLDVEVFAYVFARDWSHFLSIQEELLLKMMEIVAAAGTQLAFPSQTLYISGDGAEAVAKTAEPRRRAASD